MSDTGCVWCGNEHVHVNADNLCPSCESRLHISVAWGIGEAEELLRKYAEFQTWCNTHEAAA